MAFLIVTITFMISEMNIVTSKNSRIDISTSNNLIIIIRNSHFY